MRVTGQVGLIGTFCAVISASAAAAPIIIDDFEVDEGHFASDPNGSGSNRNICCGGTPPPRTPTSADQTTADAFTGSGSELLNIVVLRPGEVGGNNAGFNEAEGWRLRFLSGGASPANNVNIGPDGYVGYFLKTTTPGLQASILIDDLPGPVGTAGDHELAAYQDIIADDQWHLYQFNLDDSSNWSRFASATTGPGTGPGIDGSNVSIDAIMLRYPLTENRPDAVINLDTVAYNTTGDLSSLVPEPGSAALLGAGALLLLRRRK